MERKPIAELYSGAGVLKMNFNDLLKSSSSASATPSSRQGIRIPVLGRVVAGIPIEAITDIIDYEEIDPDLAKTGDFFALHGEIHNAGSALPAPAGSSKKHHRYK